MKIVLVQPVLRGSIRDEKVLDFSLKIAKNIIIRYKADIYVFPEIFFGRYANERMGELQELSGNSTIIAGGVKYDKGLHNSLFIITKKSVQRHDKVELWGNESRYFIPGKSFKTYNIFGKKAALFDCADFANPKFKRSFFYNKEALDSLFCNKKKPVMIFVLSKALKKGIKGWFIALKKASENYSTNIFFCNYKGEIREEDEVFGGGFSGYYCKGVRQKIKKIQGKNYDLIEISINF